MSEEKNNELGVEIQTGSATESPQAERQIDVGKMSLADVLLLAGNDYRDVWNKTHEHREALTVGHMVASHVSCLAWLLALDHDPGRVAGSIIEIMSKLPGMVVTQREKNLAHISTVGIKPS